MGMREGDPLPVDVAGLGPASFVGDVITRPAVSPLIAAARRIGCGTSTGGDMFAAVSGLIVDVLVEDGMLA
jgi:shikimate dehydrogenase